jgi:hypothetical protein
MGAVMAGLAQSLAHQAAETNHAIEASQRDHFTDGRHATAFFANQPGQRAAIFHFAGGVSQVAQFVFQPLDIQLVAAAVRAMAR